MEFLGMSIWLILIIVGALASFGVFKLAKGKRGKQLGWLLVIIGVIGGGYLGSLGGAVSQSTTGINVDCTISEGETYMAVDNQDDHLIHLQGTDAQLNNTAFGFRATCVRNSAEANLITVSVSNPAFKHPTDTTDLTDYFLLKKFSDGSDYAYANTVKLPTSIGYAEGTVSQTIIMNGTSSDTATGLGKLEQYKGKSYSYNIGNDIVTVQMLSTSA